MCACVCVVCMCVCACVCDSLAMYGFYNVIFIEIENFNYSECYIISRDMSTGYRSRVLARAFSEWCTPCLVHHLALETPVHTWFEWRLSYS